MLEKQICALRTALNSTISKLYFFSGICCAGLFCQYRLLFLRIFTLKIM